MGTANIVFGYASNLARADRAPLFVQSGDGENLTTNASTATTSNISAPARSADRYARDTAVRITLTEEGYVRINGTATVGTGMRCLPDIEYYFGCEYGATVSVIDTA